MLNFGTRKCHKCKHTLRRKNLIELRGGKAICDIHSKGIPEDIFLKGKHCKDFELAYKYDILKILLNIIKKINGKNNIKKDINKYKNNKVVSINKNLY